MGGFWLSRNPFPGLLGDSGFPFRENGLFQRFPFGQTGADEEGGDEIEGAVFFQLVCKFAEISFVEIQ